MKNSTLQCVNECVAGVLQRLGKIASNRSGNFGLTFALLAVPTLLGVGASLDYVRVYNSQVKMQSDLDAALLAAVHDVDTLTEASIRTKVSKWFAAQTNSNSYTLDVNKITVDKTNHAVTAAITGSVATTLLSIAGINSVNIAATSSVAGPSTSYLNVYIVLDKSASMLLAATTAGQTTMAAIKDTSGNASNCVFACHVVENGPWKVGSTTYSTLYEAAKAANVTVRADVAVTAAQKVLTLIDEADSAHTRIKVGLYTLGSTATEVLAPTFTTSTAESALTNNTSLTSATSIAYSYFDKSLPALTTLVGSAGDGTTASNPLKLVLLLTDGVESQRSWVTYNPQGKWVCVQTLNGACVQYSSTYFPQQLYTSPLNPTWCKAMKTASVTVGVLYTEYLSIPTDWGYNGTAGETMKSSAFTTTWGGTMHAGVSNTTSRRDYIPYALQDCATSSDMFLSASSQADIESGLASIFQSYIGSVRLTQ
jgi:Flp pilus assembly protein TadG